jgi:hypothetical protein
MSRRDACCARPNARSEAGHFWYQGKTLIQLNHEALAK